jgi:predicted dinucleotide-binding enzyme
MSTKQTIAIIGASGKVGTAISKSLSKGNYRLLLCSDEWTKAQAVANEITTSIPAADVEALQCSAEATWEADIIIIATPYAVQQEIALKIKDFANQKVVISIASPLTETVNGVTAASEISAAEELQQLLPNSKVVKAFNTTLATDVTSPIIDGKQIDVFIAGNDTEALQVVSELLSTAGFNPIIAGSLSISRTLESHAAFVGSLNRVA